MKKTSTLDAKQWRVFFGGTKTWITRSTNLNRATLSRACLHPFTRTKLPPILDLEHPESILHPVGHQCWPGLVTNSILFCRLFKIMLRLLKKCVLHNQVLRQLFLTESWDLRA